MKLWNRLWFAYFVALLVWGGQAYSEIGRYMQSGTLFARVLDGRPYVSDFVIFYGAAVLSRQCLERAPGAPPPNIYDVGLQNATIAPLIAPVKPEQPFYLQYPPYFFALVTPLAFVSMPVAYLLWTALCATLVVTTLVLLARQELQGRFSRTFFVVATLASFPAWLSFELGQSALYMLPIIALVFRLLRRDLPLQAGAAAALATVKLQYAPLLAVIGISAAGGLSPRGGAFLSGITGGFFALVALAVMVLGPENVLNYPHALIAGETGKSVSGVSPHMMQNIRGWLTIVTHSEAKWIMVVCAIALVLAMFFCYRLFCSPKTLALTGSEKQKHFSLASAVSVLLLLVTSPHTHVQDYLLAAYASLFLWSYFDLSKLDGQDQNRQQGIVLKGFLLALPAASWVFFIGQPFFATIGIQPYFFWAVAVLALTWFLTVRHSIQVGQHN